MEPSLLVTRGHGRVEADRGDDGFSAPDLRPAEQAVHLEIARHVAQDFSPHRPALVLREPEGQAGDEVSDLFFIEFTGNSPGDSFSPCTKDT